MDLQRYRSLFVNRGDVFAVQLPSGAYLPQKRDLTDDDVLEHLAGMWSIGTYVINPENQSVRFICWDLDTHDEATLELLVELVLEMVAGVTEGLPFYTDGMYPSLMMERSGNKGTHLWLFLTDPIPAARARAWVERDFTPEWTALNKGAIEVFPKQDAVMEGGFGNLIKLPLGLHAVSERWSEIVPYQGWASSIEEVVPLDSSLVPDLVPTQVASSTQRRTTGRGPTSPFPCIDQIIERGAGKGQRDNAMFHLALYLQGHAVPEDLALEMCRRANENFDPPVPARDIERKVEQAYSGRYTAANCGSDWLRTFCEGPCRAGWSVKKAPEKGGLAKAEEGSTVEVQIVSKRVERGRTRFTLSHPDSANNPTLIVG